MEDLTLFFKCKNEGRLNKMSYLIYWYGSIDENELYGFSPLSSLRSHDDVKDKEIQKTIHKKGT